MSEMGGQTRKPVRLSDTSVLAPIVFSNSGSGCSLIPGLGVKLSNDHPCRAHCSLRGRGKPSA